MVTLSHKAKQYLLVALKVLILAATFGYIYVKLQDTNVQTIEQFTTSLTRNTQTTAYLLLFVFLTISNWFFEILKWKTVVSAVEKIPFWTATKQSLSALTVSLITPNRIGDYGAKAMYYEPSKRKQILLLNFFSNGMQMCVTVIFGVIGLAFVHAYFDISISLFNLALLFIIVLLFAFLAYLFKERELLVKGFTIAKVWLYLKQLSGQIKLKTATYSLIRYTLFSLLFYALLRFFGVNESVWILLPIIFAMYLLVSIIPTLFILDVVVRGGVAVWLFSLAGIPELPVLCTVLTMWLLNFVIPAIWGSFYVLTFKPKIA